MSPVAKRFILPDGFPGTVTHEPSWGVTIPFDVLIHAETAEDAVTIAYSLAEWGASMMQHEYVHLSDKGFVVAVDIDDVEKLERQELDDAAKALVAKNLYTLIMSHDHEASKEWRLEKLDKLQRNLVTGYPFLRDYIGWLDLQNRAIFRGLMEKEPESEARTLVLQQLRGMEEGRM